MIIYKRIKQKIYRWIDIFTIELLFLHWRCHWVKFADV
jgi:hypothetical protein